MSEARNLARALNLSHRDGLDMMGGADAEAIEELINNSWLQEVRTRFLTVSHLLQL